MAGLQFLLCCTPKFIGLYFGFLARDGDTFRLSSRRAVGALRYLSGREEHPGPLSRDCKLAVGASRARTPARSPSSSPGPRR